MALTHLNTAEICNKGRPNKNSSGLEIVKLASLSDLVLTGTLMIVVGMHLIASIGLCPNR